MTNEEIAIRILTRYGYNVRLNRDNYGEVRSAIIQVLDLADEGNHSEAKKRAVPLDEVLRADVEAVIEKKGAK